MSLLALFAASSDVNDVVNTTPGALKRLSESIFSIHSLMVLAVCIIIASIIGRVISMILRFASRVVGNRADASSNLNVVNQLRRVETWIVLSIAMVRLLLAIMALYFWWIVVHPQQQPTAMVGASALIIVIVGGVFGPLLRDLSFGGGMMAEHWFGVGDLVTIEPSTLQGVVERITLRSTRIRGLSGEVIWVSNQNIWSVSIAQKGVHTMAIELFVNDNVLAEELIDKVNVLLPTGPSLIARPLAIMEETEREKNMWHITAITETAPGRNWLVERTAIDLLKDLDQRSEKPVLVTEPVARYADNDTEREFARAVTNAKKSRPTRRRPVKTKK